MFSEKWRGRIKRYAPIILWIGVIFYLSSDDGSMNQTSRYIRPILIFLFPTAPEETIQAYHAFIRKSAHFFEYAVLAFLVFRASASSEALYKYRFVIPVAVATMIAAVDETNQSFRISRTGSIWDVALDISGAFAMVLVLSIVKWRPRQISAGTLET